MVVVTVVSVAVVVVMVVSVAVVSVVVVSVVVDVDVHGSSQSVGQCSRAKSPWSPNRVQSALGMRVPQPRASWISLHG